eukprot:4174292-Prymnesium_polylepis.1
MHGSGVGLGAEGWFARLAHRNTSSMRGERSPAPMKLISDCSRRRTSALFAILNDLGISDDLGGISPRFVANVSRTTDRGELNRRPQTMATTSNEGSSLGAPRVFRDFCFCSCCVGLESIPSA